MQPSGVQGERGKSAREPPGIVRMQAVDILGGIDGIDHGFRMQMFGNGNCTRCRARQDRG